MSRAWALVATPLASLRRAVTWWTVGLAGLVVVTVAFWPAFRGSSGIAQAIDQLPDGFIQVFGLQDFGTPAGFLRGNLYEFFVPLLLAAAAVAFVSGQTAGDEASGRLELYFAQPIDHGALYLGRAVASLVGLAVVVAVLMVVQIAADLVVDLRIGLDRIVATVLLSGMLAALFGALAFAVAGARARPSLVLGIGIGGAVAAYLVAALLPLSAVLAPWRGLSPWDWAFGGDPLAASTEPWRYAVLAIGTVALAVLGAYLVRRRDAAGA
jgi:ABC-2 type transport system permease protein